MNARQFFRRCRGGVVSLPAPSVSSPAISGSFADVPPGSAYSQSIPITGGAPPYTLSVESGALPPGFTIQVVGDQIVISGTTVN